MKKLLFVFILCALLCVVFATTSFAAATNEFGEVETFEGIDLSKMSTDTTSRVVLFDGTEYHTYPANYIIKSSSDLSVDFSKIKAASGYNYGVSSIIRIEIPTTVKSFKTPLNGNQGGKNIVEVSFPEGTQVTEIVWGALMNCSKLERIEIPATVELLGQDAFSNCASLSSVTFAENSKLKTINQGCFGSCKLLTEVILPNSVESIGKAAFYNCTGLKKLVLGANTTVFGGELDGAYGYNDATSILEIYMNGAFATGEGSLASGNFLGRGNSRDLSKYIIFFTGTRDEALALMSKYSTDVNLKDANLVAYDPNKATGTDYFGMDPYTTDITVNTNRVIVYGYNLCEAFYNGVHAEGQVLNSCQFGCGRECGQVSLLENPVHSLSMRTELGANGYLGDFAVVEQCSVCQTKTVDEAILPLFTSKGYSAKTFGDSMGLVQGYEINKDAINEYKSFITDFKFGLLAYANVIGGEVAPLPTDSGVVDVIFDSMANNYIEISVVGIPSTHADTAFIFCIYVTEGENIYYIDNGETKTATQGVSYNELA